MLKDFAERPDLICLMFNWLLRDNGMEEDLGKSRDNRDGAILVALEKGFQKSGGR